MMKILLFSLALALTLTACGQKGALYLPEKSPTPPHSTPLHPNARRACGYAC
ncbi:LPS translocon maturation chaperone LptM [Moraxella bovis]|uniref:LPS translocon maturation chaperone LptM n=1 Tax=Moraxella bovis TaxID=476 RepID=UPI001FEC8EF6|nr:lipoprotein [Moraxella bovis]